MQTDTNKKKNESNNKNYGKRKIRKLSRQNLMCKVCQPRQYHEKKISDLFGRNWMEPITRNTSEKHICFSSGGDGPA